MRLKLILRSPGPDTRLPLSYNAALSSSLKVWVDSVSGFGEHPFVFSRLIIKSKLVDVKSSTIRILSPTVHLHVGCYTNGASIDDLMGALIGRSTAFGLRVEKVELLTPPRWSAAMRFRMLSPTIARASGGEFLFPDDPCLYEHLRERLLDRYVRARGGAMSSSEDVMVLMEEKYIAQRGGTGAIAKVVRFQDEEGTTHNLKAFTCPVVLRGSPDLIAFAYDAGIGDYTTYGFGMIG